MMMESDRTSPMLRSVVSQHALKDYQVASKRNQDSKNSKAVGFINSRAEA